MIMAKRLYNGDEQLNDLGMKINDNVNKRIAAIFRKHPDVSVRDLEMVVIHNVMYVSALENLHRLSNKQVKRKR